MALTATLAKHSFTVLRNGILNAISRHAAPVAQATSAKVISLHPSSSPADSATAPREPGAADLVTGRDQPMQSTRNGRSPHEDPVLVAFRAESHLDAGYKAAIVSPNHEALELELQSLAARFDDCLTDMVDKRVALVQGLEACALRVGNQISPLQAAALKMDIEQHHAAMAEIELHRGLAKELKGWFRAPQTAFVIGFRRGLDEAVAVQRLLA